MAETNTLGKWKPPTTTGGTSLSAAPPPQRIDRITPDTGGPWKFNKAPSQATSVFTPAQITAMRGQPQATGGGGTGGGGGGIAPSPTVNPQAQQWATGTSGVGFGPGNIPVPTSAPQQNPNGLPTNIGAFVQPPNVRDFGGNWTDPGYIQAVQQYRAANQVYMNSMQLQGRAPTDAEMLAGMSALSTPESRQKYYNDLTWKTQGPLGQVLNPVSKVGTTFSSMNNNPYQPGGPGTPTYFSTPGPTGAQVGGQFAQGPSLAGGIVGQGGGLLKYSGQPGQQNFNIYDPYYGTSVYQGAGTGGTGGGVGGAGGGGGGSNIGGGNGMQPGLAGIPPGLLAQLMPYIQNLQSMTGMTGQWQNNWPFSSMLPFSSMFSNLAQLWPIMQLLNYGGQSGGWNGLSQPTGGTGTGAGGYGPMNPPTWWPYSGM